MSLSAIRGKTGRSGHPEGRISSLCCRKPSRITASVTGSMRKRFIQEKVLPQLFQGI